MALTFGAPLLGTVLLNEIFVMIFLIVFKASNINHYRSKFCPVVRQEAVFWCLLELRRTSVA